MPELKIWEDYLSPIRKECEPCFIVDNEIKDNAIVLIHGLTDSPFFMKAIGQYFHEHMGFNVFIPLLAGHGLKEPDGMRNVTLEQWKNNINYAVETAQKYAKTISIGGLSTGGALSVYQALNYKEQINGGVFLFSAALDLTSIYGDLVGNLKEFLLKLTITKVLAEIQDIKGYNPLIGENPYRYAAMDIHGAIQLENLIQEIEQGIEKAALSQPIFAAHSEADDTANFYAVVNFMKQCQIHQLFRIPKQLQVAHASVVLQNNIEVNTKNGGIKVLEKKNPVFDNMMKTAHEFASNHLKNVKPLPSLV